MEYGESIDKIFENNEVHELITLAFDQNASPKGVATLLLTLRSIYVKLFLIEENRFGDLNEYTQNGNAKFELESGFRIEALMDWPLEREEKPIGIFQLYLSAPSVNNPVILKSLHNLCDMIYGS